MEFVNQEDSDSEDDLPLRILPFHRKAREKVKEVEGVLAYHYENNWQLGIVHDRIREMHDRIKDICDRAREVTSGLSDDFPSDLSDEIKREVDEIRSKIAQFVEEMKVITILKIHVSLTTNPSGPKLIP